MENRKIGSFFGNYMNDSFRTDVFVRHTPETIACACIFLAARNLQIPLPNSPPWFAVFRVEEYEIADICRSILRLYTRTKPNVDELERTVNEVKKTHIDAKLKAKGVTSANVTPNSSSRPASPAKVSPSPLTMPGLKKIKSEDDKSDHSSFGGGRDYNHTSSKKKRGHSHSSSRSRSHSRSRSRSKARSYSSRSHSRSPAPKRRYITPPKKSKKESRRREKYSYRDRDYKENRDKYYKDSYNDGYKEDYGYKDYGASYNKDKDYGKDYKESHRDKDYKYVSHKGHRSSSLTPERERQRSYSRSPGRSRSGHRKPHKEKSRKHNGHRRSRSRERYRR